MPDAATTPEDTVRLVSLSPNLTEMIVAIGASDLLVGRSSACDYPPEAVRAIPIAGGFGAPELETVARMRPSLVVYTDLADKRIPARLSALGIASRHVPCASVDEVLSGILKLGDLSGRQSQAETLHGDLATAIAQLRDAQAQREAQGERIPTVFVEIWHRPPMTCGRTSFVSELVALAGGRNLGDDSPQAYFAVDGEWVLARNPDILYLAYMSAETTPLQRLQSRPGWNALHAVRHGDVYQAENADWMLRPGPRLLRGIDDLRACIARHHQP